MAQIIDGKKIAAELQENIKQRAVAFEQQYQRQPGLAVVLVGQNPASEIYVRRKMAACQQAHILSFPYFFEESVTKEKLLQTIDHLNHDPAIDGILIQLPLPSHLNPLQIVSSISPLKDVDGLHPYNQGLLALGHPQFVPCTPLGCVQLIESCKKDVTGANVVVLGRSILVGRPLAALLTLKNATVTLAHSYTKNLQAVCQQADILIIAVGKAQFLTADFVKEGAIVIDVGINRLEEGQQVRLVGDVAFDQVAEKASFITPVPGGVGPMTIANLLANTLQAAEKNKKKSDIVFPFKT